MVLCLTWCSHQQAMSSLYYTPPMLTSQIVTFTSHGFHSMLYSDAVDRALHTASVMDTQCFGSFDCLLNNMTYDNN